MLRASKIRVKLYDILSRAVEDGISQGIRRANKYADVVPLKSEGHITEQVYTAVMGELCDVLDFSEDETSVDDAPSVYDGDGL